MPTATRGVRREHVESYIAKRSAVVKPTTLSVEFRALQQFFRWALEEEEIDRSPRGVSASEIVATNERPSEDGTAKGAA